MAGLALGVGLAANDALRHQALPGLTVHIAELLLPIVIGMQAAFAFAPEDEAPLEVLMACPRPLPVQFSVSYQENGRMFTAQLPGFPDLGQVTYSGCKGNS